MTDAIKTKNIGTIDNILLDSRYYLLAIQNQLRKTENKSRGAATLVEVVYTVLFLLYTIKYNGNK